jgi:phosphoglycolate phosphatase-like HAD superfamily hydrolase
VLGWDAVVHAHRLAARSARAATRRVLGHEFPRNATELTWASGLPVAELFALLTDDRLTVAELLEAYEQEYLGRVGNGVTARPGWSLLVAAARPMMPIAVVALEEQHLVEAAAAASDVAGDLDVLVCDTGSRERPPHPAALLVAIDRCAASVDTALFVATTAAEVTAARSAGVAAVVLDTGIGPPIEPGGMTVDSLAALADLVALNADRGAAARAEPRGASRRGTDRSG